MVVSSHSLISQWRGHGRMWYRSVENGLLLLPRKIIEIGKLRCDLLWRLHHRLSWNQFEVD
jgi:hypothetical protein